MDPFLFIVLPPGFYTFLYANILLFVVNASLHLCLRFQYYINSKYFFIYWQRNVYDYSLIKIIYIYSSSSQRCNTLFFLYFIPHSYCDTNQGYNVIMIWNKDFSFDFLYNRLYEIRLILGNYILGLYHVALYVELIWRGFFTPPRNRGGVIFSMHFVCVCVSVCVSVCLCVYCFLVNKIPAERMYRFELDFR